MTNPFFVLSTKKPNQKIWSFNQTAYNELQPQFAKKKMDFKQYYNSSIKKLLTQSEWKKWYNKRTEYINGASFVKIDDGILIL